MDRSRAKEHWAKLLYSDQRLLQKRLQANPPMTWPENLVPRSTDSSLVPWLSERFAKSRERLIFKKAPFRRLIKWVASQVASGNWFANGIPNFTPDARDSLREMTEAYMVELMHAANLEAIHRKQFTIQPKDIQIARRVRGERD
jgi:histone H3